MVLADPVELIPYEPRHLDALIPRWRASFEAGVGVIDPNPIEEQRDYFLSEVVTRNRVRVAVCGRELVGFIAATPESIAQLYVFPGFQRQGLGRRMLQWAKNESCGSLWLYTFSRNARARAFYERNGFQPIEFGFEPTWGLHDVKYFWSGPVAT